MQKGWARQPLLDCNLDRARFYRVRPLQRFRISRWDYYGVTSPDLYFSAPLADLGYGGQVFNLVDFADGTYHESVLIDWPEMRGGAGFLTLVGNETSPANVVLDGEGTIEETGILVLGIAAIRGIEITGFREEGLEVNFGLMFVDNCRIINNGTGTGYDGVGVFGARADISNTVIANNGDSGIEIEDGASNVHLSNVEITGNANHGIEVDDSSHVHLGGGTLLIQSNGGIGVRAWDGSSVNFNGEAGLTIQLNPGGSMSARYHSTIRGYGSGTTGSCSADTQSICEP